MTGHMCARATWGNMGQHGYGHGREHGHGHGYGHCARYRRRPSLKPRRSPRAAHRAPLTAHRFSVHRRHQSPPTATLLTARHPQHPLAAAARSLASGARRSLLGARSPAISASLTKPSSVTTHGPSGGREWTVGAYCGCSTTIRSKRTSSASAA
eukprot:6599436-Prymnesium_polylepis.2